MSARTQRTTVDLEDSDRIVEPAAIEALARSLIPHPSALRPDAAERARVLASVMRRGRFGRFADRIARLFDCPISVAEELALRLEDDAAWGLGLLPGSSMIPILAGPKYPTAIASFVKFVPGLHFPLHAHPGGEITFVLDGAFRDASGVRIARGEELALGDDVIHDFVVLDEGPCIAAAIAYDGIDLK